MLTGYPVPLDNATAEWVANATYLICLNVQMTPYIFFIPPLQFNVLKVCCAAALPECVEVFFKMNGISPH